jgi:hypothetical protein
MNNEPETLRPIDVAVAEEVEASPDRAGAESSPSRCYICLTLMESETQLQSHVLQCAREAGSGHSGAAGSDGATTRVGAVPESPSTSTKNRDDGFAAHSTERVAPPAGSPSPDHLCPTGGADTSDAEQTTPLVRSTPQTTFVAELSGTSSSTSSATTLAQRRKERKTSSFRRSGGLASSTGGGGNDSGQGGFLDSGSGSASACGVGEETERERDREAAQHWSHAQLEDLTMQLEAMRLENNQRMQRTQSLGALQGQSTAGGAAGGVAGGSEGELVVGSHEGEAQAPPQRALGLKRWSMRQRSSERPGGQSTSPHRLPEEGGAPSHQSQQYNSHQRALDGLTRAATSTEIELNRPGGLSSSTSTSTSTATLHSHSRSQQGLSKSPSKGVTSPNASPRKNQAPQSSPTKPKAAVPPPPPAAAAAGTHRNPQSAPSLESHVELAPPRTAAPADSVASGHRGAAPGWNPPAKASALVFPRHPPSSVASTPSRQGSDHGDSNPELDACGAASSLDGTLSGSDPIISHHEREHEHQHPTLGIHAMADSPPPCSSSAGDADEDGGHRPEGISHPLSSEQDSTHTKVFRQHEAHTPVGTKRGSTGVRFQEPQGTKAGGNHFASSFSRPSVNTHAGRRSSSAGRQFAGTASSASPPQATSSGHSTSVGVELHRDKTVTVGAPDSGPAAAPSSATTPAAAASKEAGASRKSAAATGPPAGVTVHRQASPMMRRQPNPSPRRPTPASAATESGNAEGIHPQPTSTTGFVNATHAAPGHPRPSLGPATGTHGSGTVSSMKTVVGVSGSAAASRPRASTVMRASVAGTTAPALKTSNPALAVSSASVAAATSAASSSSRPSYMSSTKSTLIREKGPTAGSSTDGAHLKRTVGGTFSFITPTVTGASGTAATAIAMGTSTPARHGQGTSSTPGSRGAAHPSGARRSQGAGDLHLLDESPQPVAPISLFTAAATGSRTLHVDPRHSPPSQQSTAAPRNLGRVSVPATLEQLHAVSASAAGAGAVPFAATDSAPQRTSTPEASIVIVQPPTATTPKRSTGSGSHRPAGTSSVALSSAKSSQHTTASSTDPLPPSPTNRSRNQPSPGDSASASLSSTVTEIRFCPSCGERFLEAAKFCAFCGLRKPTTFG